MWLWLSAILFLYRTQWTLSSCSLPIYISARVYASLWFQVTHASGQTFWTWCTKHVHRFTKQIPALYIAPAIHVLYTWLPPKFLCSQIAANQLIAFRSCDQQQPISVKQSLNLEFSLDLDSKEATSLCLCLENKLGFRQTKCLCYSYGYKDPNPRIKHGVRSAWICFYWINFSCGSTRRES